MREESGAIAAGGFQYIWIEILGIEIDMLLNLFGDWK